MGINLNKIYSFICSGPFSVLRSASQKQSDEMECRKVLEDGGGVQVGIFDDQIGGRARPECDGGECGSLCGCGLQTQHRPVEESLREIPDFEGTEVIAQVNNLHLCRSSPAHDPGAVQKFCKQPIHVMLY